MKRFFLALALAAAAVPAAAVIRFNSGVAITANGDYEGSKRSPGGGVVLWVTGTFGGATVTLKGDPGGGPVAADTCDAITSAGVCRAGVGPVDVSVTVSGASGTTSLVVVGYEANLVVASTALGGVGEVSFADVTAGTNPNALLVSGSLGKSGDGSVTADQLASAALDALDEIAAGLCAEGEILKRGESGWGCAVDESAGSPTFADVTTGESTGQTLDVGAGSTLQSTGGTITADTLSVALSAVLGGWGADVSALDCSGNANGGKITASAPGVFGCADDESPTLTWSAMSGGTAEGEDFEVGASSVFEPVGDGVITANDLSDGTVADLAMLDSALCGTGQVLEDQGGSWACIDTPGGAPAFSDLTSATNTTAAMVVGSGASLAATGSGAITATSMAASGLTGALGVASSVFNVDPGSTGGVNFNFSESYFTFGSTPISGSSGVGIYNDSGNLHFTNSGPTGWRLRIASNILESRTTDGPRIALDAGTNAGPNYSFVGDADTGILREWDTTGGLKVNDEAQTVARFVYSTHARVYVGGALSFDTSYSAAPTVDKPTIVRTAAGDLCYTENLTDWTSLINLDAGEHAACSFV